MKIVAITQARVGSSRLPAKVLKIINGISILELHIKRILKSRKISKLIVATTEEPEAKAICDICDDLNVSYYRGSMNDVLDRFYKAALLEQPDYVVRITSDCPLIDSDLIDQIIEQSIINQVDYFSNGLVPCYPDGQDVEVFRFSALSKAWNEATLLSDREHVTPYIWRNSTFKGGSLFSSLNFGSQKDFSTVRMTLDEEADLKVISSLIERLGTEASWLDYADLYLNDQILFNQNSHITRNEGYIKSLEKD
jgi:spore coat polysaccharide biosynthesis protein SpsF (cytidylyltransferase family)